MLGGEAASLREAPLSPQTPLSRRAAGNRLDSSSKLAPPASWTRVPAAWLWSRRLTEPPRPAAVGRAWGCCEGGGFSERSPSLALPPEERRGIRLTLPPSLRPLRVGRGCVAAWLWSSAADRAAATCRVEGTMGNRLNASSKLAPPASWARVLCCLVPCGSRWLSRAAATVQRKRTGRIKMGGW